MEKYRQGFKALLKKVTALVTTAAMLVTCYVFGVGSLAAKASGAFTAEQGDNNGNYVSLNWDGMTGSSFMVEKEGSSDSTYQTIPLNTNITVLNIYPDSSGIALSGSDGTSYELQSWMATYGNKAVDGTKYNMSVDNVGLSVFDSDPDTYLKSNGSYKYNVLYFGAWDCNGGEDLSTAATSKLDSFINAGGGCVFGHDTASFDHSNFITLAEKYLNMKVHFEDHTNIPTYGNTKVAIAKKGSLMNYPYVLGSVGDILTTPMSHSYYEFAMGDIWFKYSGSSGWDNTEVSTYDGESGTNNFYLTTWNNVAMIQTGHSEGQATEDEQKITTNLLYDLAQITTGTSFDDHTAQDLAAPDKVTGSVSLSTVSGGNTKISFGAASDNGSYYSYKLDPIDSSGNKLSSTGTASATVTTGVAGYAVSVDQNATSDPGNTVNATTAEYDAGSSLTAGQTYYAHIRTIDNADNESDVSNITFTVAPTLTLSATAGSTAGTTIIGVTSMQSANDTLEYQVSSKSIDTPSVGTSVTYDSLSTSGTISSVTSGEYVGVYEVDSSGNVMAFSEMQLTDTEIGTSAPVAGSGSALSFDGTDDYVTIPSSSKYTTNNFTVEAWVKFSGQYYAGIIDKGYNEGKNWYIISADNGTKGIIVGTPVAALNYNWNDDNWHHISMTYDGSTLCLYVDGILRGSQAASGYTPTDSGITFGRRLTSDNVNAWRYYGGSLDEVKIWNTARTQSQIQSDMYSHVSSSATGLIGYWNFDEGSGGTAYDSSSSVVNGTLTNMDNSAWVNSPAWQNRTTTENTAITLDAGYMPGGGSVTLAQTATPSHGSLSFSNSTKTVTYTPTPDWYGSDTFTYEVTSSSGKSSTYTVDMTVEQNITAPGAPTNVSATAGDGEATVTFTAPSSDGGSAITGYTVTATPSDGGAAITATGIGCTITVTGLTNGTTYTITVTATNSAGTGAQSGSVNATPEASVTVPTVPGAPTNVSATAGDGEATVTFTAPSSDGGSAITGYTVTATPSDGGAAITATGIGCTITVTGLTNGTTYTITVTATNSAGTGAQSGSVNATPEVSVTVPTVPGAPTNVSATAGDGEATVTFTAPSSNGGSAITGYTVTATPSDGGAAITATGTGCTITVTGLTNGTTYTITVTATNSAGTGTQSGSVNATPEVSVTVPTVPGAPTNVSATAGDGEATVTFTAPSSDGGSAITGYAVTATPSDGGAAITATGTGCTITVTGLTNGTTYTITVTATNSAGTGAQSGSVNATPEASVTVPTVPGAPTNVSATAGDGEATVTFTAPSSDGGSAITGYTVTATPSDGGAAITATGTGCTITVTGLTNGTTYTITVTATNSAGTGTQSGSVNATPEVSVTVPTVPGAPTNVSATAGDGEATVTFTAPSSNGGSAITGYTVTATPSDGGAAITATGTGCTITVTGLTNGTTYTITVTAANSAGTGAQSDVSSSVKISSGSSSGSGGSSGSSSNSGGSSTSPVDVTIAGSSSSSSEPTSSAKIPASDTDTSTVKNVIVNLSDVTVTASSSVLNSALGSDSSSWLVLSEDTTSAATQTKVNTAANSDELSPVRIMDVNLTKYYSNGTLEAVHQLIDNVTVSIKLTSAQIVLIKSASSAQLLYFDTSTEKLTNMNATFDLTAGTATFQTNHFSTFVIVTPVKLGTASNLSWDTTITGKATWSEVANASSYKVQLLKDGVVVDTVTVAAGTTSYDFTSVIKANGSGTYTFTVTAIGDGISYTSGDTGTSAGGYTYGGSTSTGGSTGTGTGTSTGTIGVTYTTYVRGTGWQSFVSDGKESGTDHHYLRAEAVKIKLTGDVPAGASIIYEAHVGHLGWLPAVSDGATAGTTGQSRRLEAIRITLAGMPGYEVRYRVHVKHLGWLAWQTTVNGTDIADAAVAGTTGQYRRAEAIEIEIVKIA